MKVVRTYSASTPCQMQAQSPRRCKEMELEAERSVICWDGEGNTFSFPVGFCAHYDLKNNVSPGAILVERRERVHNPICVLEAWAFDGVVERLGGLAEALRE